MEFLATAAFGLEGVVKQELEGLGIPAKAEQGGARFSATWEQAFLANLWLSCADRVLLVLKEQKVQSFEALFDMVKSIPWENYLPRDAVFPVNGNCVRSQLMSLPDCQRITKKAIVERLKRHHRVDWFPETGQTYPVSVTIHRDLARISLDTSGEALNRRGYRTWTGEAPLRETLAAALLRLSPWDGVRPLVDPCCGTGTLLIEAALQAAHRAPGLQRAFLMENWAAVDQTVLRRIRNEAKQAVSLNDIQEISGSDIDPEALRLANLHIKQAGLSGRVQVQEQDLRQVRLDGPPPVFITNPPYGERLGDQKTAQAVVRDLGELLRRHPGAALCAISPDSSFERLIGRKANRRRRLYNGRLECEYLIFET